ncbi:MAG: hypothetical protein DI582_06835 [Azospirillum brasilense]|nr:MAG: hypothetical protein DI582_06835 [Azospirillum brasilense]
MDNFENFAKRLLQGKGVALLAFVIFLLVLFFKYGDFVDSINLNLNMKKAEAAKEAEQVTPASAEDSTGRLRIADITMAPVKFKMPAAFYVNVESTGPDDATDVRVVVDFKTAEIVEKDIRSTALCRFKNVIGQSVSTVECPRLPKGESVGLYFFLSTPSFGKITATASNMPSAKTATSGQASNAVDGLQPADVFQWIFVGMVCLLMLVAGCRLARFLAFGKFE